MQIQGKESTQVPKLLDLISEAEEICNDLGNINGRLETVNISLVGSRLKDSSEKEEKSPESAVYRLKYLLLSAASKIAEIKKEVALIEKVTTTDNNPTKEDTDY